MPIVHVNQREPYLSHGAEVAFLINNESSAAFRWRITHERSGVGEGRRWRPKFEQQKRRRWRRKLIDCCDIMVAWRALKRDAAEPATARWRINHERNGRWWLK
eukprot:scaffold16282_cov40-Cyclotella_meneghiniana.AAC.2